LFSHFKITGWISPGHSLSIGDFRLAISDSDRRFLSFLNRKSEIRNRVS